MSQMKHVLDSQPKNSKRKTQTEQQYENIIVGLRLRPIDQQEKVCQVINEKSVLVKKSNEKFQFDKIFDENASSNSIFDKLIQPIVSKVIGGYNGSVCAYGQTCSGKTYTMKGSATEPGLIQLSIDYIFRQMQKISDHHFQVKISYIEIYNENIYDLLIRDMQEMKPLQFNEYKWEHIQDLSTFEQIFKFGEEQRHFGETKMNENSSRSHVILQVLIESRTKFPPFVKKTSQLNLVDLAGSEALSKTQAEGQRRKEGFLINKSLLALQSVVMRIKENKKDQFVNFRDSKLTQILKRSLNGNSITAFLLTISQSIENYQESINTMKFGIAAGALKNIVSTNECFEGNNIQVELLSEQLEQLKFENIQISQEVRTIAEQQMAKEFQIDDLQQQLDIQLRQRRILEEEVLRLTQINNQLCYQNQDLSKEKADLLKEINEIREASTSNFRLYKQYQRIVEEKGLLTTILKVESITQTDDENYKMQEQENIQLKEQLQQLSTKFQSECNQLRETIQIMQKPREYTPIKQPKPSNNESLLQKSLKKNNEYLETLLTLWKANLQTLHLEQTKQNMILRNALDKKEREYFEIEQANCQLHRSIFELQEKLCEYEQITEQPDFWKENREILAQNNPRDVDQNKKERKKLIQSPSKEEYRKKLQRYEQRMQVYEKDIAKQQKTLEQMQKKKHELEQFSHHLYQACVEHNLAIL